MTPPWQEPRVLPGSGQPLRSSPELFEAVHGWCESLEVDGTRLLLRSVRPQDAWAIDAFIRALSPETRYRRFHAAIRRLSAGQLAGVVDVDHHSRETLLVWAGPQLVAVGQYVQDRDHHAGFALVVADAWQGRGIGQVLAGRLARAATAAGITAFGAWVLADNRAPRRLAERLSSGIRVTGLGAVLELEIPLELAV